MSITCSRLGINRYGANPAHGQLNREHVASSVPRPRLRIWSLARQVRSFRPASPRSFPTPRLTESDWLALALGFLSLLLLSASTSVYSIPSTDIGSIPILLGRAIACRWRFPPRVRRHRAINPQVSSTDGCCLFRKTHGPFFPHVCETDELWYIQARCVKVFLYKPNPNLPVR